MNNVRKIQHKNTEILVVDYSTSNADQMIQVLEEAKALVQGGNKNVLILNIFSSKNYISPGFIKHLEKIVPHFESLIEKNVVVGLTEIQKWILKGVNLWYKREILHFDSMESAMDFLANANENNTQAK